MNIYLKVLQNKIHTLIHGEDGFALALTIALWPALVLMVSGVYVTGESIRQRIILQNAADAAAYAGALVQADSMSRIAVLNKMLAWTYVQANQMEMDYTVYNWLRKQLQKTDKVPSTITDSEEFKKLSFYDILNYVKNKESTCSGTTHQVRHVGNLPTNAASLAAIDSGEYGYYAGYKGKLDGGSVDTYNFCYVRLNDNTTVPLVGGGGICEKVGLNSSTGEPSPTEFSQELDKLEGKVKNAYSNIENLNKALADIAGKMRERITAAAKATLKKNLLEFEPGDAGICITADNIANYLKVPSDLLDTDFVGCFASDLSSVFSGSPGMGTWWTQQKDSSENLFLLRDINTSNNLSLTFDWGWKIWKGSEETGCQCGTIKGTDFDCDTNTIYADKNCRVADSSRCAAQPQILQSDSYQTKGGITVSVKHEMKNPLETFLGGSGSKFDKSFFSAYSLEKDTDMWVSASAQAGVKKLKSGTGDYTYQYTGLELADLQVTDWNAVMIPVTNDRLKTAWTTLKPNGFGSGEYSDSVWNTITTSWTSDLEH